MSINIPEGMTLEQLDEQARLYYNRKRRERYAKTPDKNKADRIRYAVNLLTKEGYTVTKEGVTL